MNKVPKVLIVDDNPDMRLLYSLMLGEFLQVSSAEDGRQASVMAAALQPDLVLLDVFMPGSSMDQTIPTIKQVAPKVKVIVLSAFSRGLYEDRALAIGADLYLEKGLTAEELRVQCFNLLNPTLPEEIA